MTKIFRFSFLLVINCHDFLSIILKFIWENFQIIKTYVVQKAYEIALCEHCISIFALGESSTSTTNVTINYQDGGNKIKAQVEIT